MMTKALPKGDADFPRIRPGVPMRSYFQALYLSFFSSSLYIDVNRQWRGLGFRYLLLLSVVFSIPWGIVETVKQSHFYHEVAVPVIKRLPTLPVINGEVQFNKPMPYFIKDNNGNTAIIIDTTGKIATLNDINYPDALLLITKNSFITHFHGMPVNSDPIPKGTDGHVDAKTFLDALSKAKTIFVSTIFPILVASLFSGLVMLAMLFSFIALYFSKFLMKYDMGYRQSIKLTSVAMTPAITALFVIYLTDHIRTYTGLLLFFILLAYYIFGARANKHAAKSLIVY